MANRGVSAEIQRATQTNDQETVDSGKVTEDAPSPADVNSVLCIV